MMMILLLITLLITPLLHYYIIDIINIAITPLLFHAIAMPFSPDYYAIIFIII
jgi:hypothetical protein